MRIILVLAGFGLACAAVAGGTYSDNRTLSLAAAGLSSLHADVGAGSLTLVGVEGAETIEVEATLWVEDHPRDLDRVRQALQRYVDISLERDGDRARLVTRTRDPGLGYSQPHVDLVVRAPTAFALDIVDRSGFIDASNFAGDVRIRDDSGSIELDRIGGAVDIDDQSGSIVLSRIAGPVVVFDESGSIELSRIGGDVTIRDGSGSIRVEKVNGDVHIRDGSGSIAVSAVSGTLRVPQAGSGTVSHDEIEGGVEIDD